MNKIASLAILAKKFGASETGQRMMGWFEANLLWSCPGQVVHVSLSAALGWCYHCDY